MKADNPTMIIRPMLGAVALVGALLVSANVSADESKAPLGHQAQEWLELQKAQKPKPEDGMSGDQATLIWERHIKSFGREIPETLHDQGSISSGGTR